MIRRAALALAVGVAWGIAAAADPACDPFIERVAEDTLRYRRAHRVHPVGPGIAELARRHRPRLWVHPESWRPVDFDAYLARARLRAEDGRVLAEPPAAGAAAQALPLAAQCRSWLEGPELAPAEPAPVYVQVFRDRGPDGGPDWLYLKYTFVFDWSGLARERSLAARVGSWLAGGEALRWHRFDVHTAAILAREILLRLVFPQPDHPLAAFAGLLAPPRRVLGMYVGRHGPPGYDFTGAPEMPAAAAMGFWREGDRAFLEVLDAHLRGFRDTDWDAIRSYLAERLAAALLATEPE